MERFEDFLESVKKIEIEDEEFKKELKRKLFELYDLRKKRARVVFYKRVLSLTIIIILIIIPSILFLLKDISIKKTALEQKTELFRTFNHLYESEINEMLLNDEILSTETREDGTTIKKYKSGLTVYEKNGYFEKLIFNENFLKENDIDLDTTKLSKDDEKKLDKILLNRVVSLLKKDIRFNFIEENKIEDIKIIKDNLIFVKVIGNKGYWIIITDLSSNKILFFVYPY